MTRKANHFNGGLREPKIACAFRFAKKLLTPNSKLLTLTSTLLTPNSKLLTLTSTLLTPNSKLLTLTSTLLTPNSKLLTLTSTLLTLLFLSCIPSTPDQYIQPDDMEDILLDYHLARSLAHNGNVPYDSIPYYQALYIEAVFRKHGVTREEFDSSMVYYYKRADRFEPVYKRVAERLEERALILGATESEIGKYASLNATGDTANIWPDRTRMAMTPIPPYNRWDFSLDIDSTYRRGDSFLMQFMSDYIYQEGSKNGIVYLAATYTDDNGRDTIISRNLHFLNSGISKLTLPACNDGDLKKLRGFFYLGDGNDRTTTVKLLFLSNVQFIRFHKKHEEIKKDSLPQDSIPQRAELAASADTLSNRDSVGNSRQVVPLDSGTTTDGMAPGRRRPLSR